MQIHTATPRPAPSGLLGSLRHWWSGRLPSGDEGVPVEGRRPQVHVPSLVQVLVADDNPVNLMVMSALMEARGLVPRLAVDGAQAVGLACAQTFDLILMDLQMPVLDGLRATAAIRQAERVTGRPAVPVLAYTSTSPGAEALAAHGVSGRLAKPCGDQELEDCLRRWCPTYAPAPESAGLALR